MWGTSILLLVLSIQAGKSGDGLGSIIVETPSGRIEGFQTESESGVLVNEFRGIRYGKAPVGALRFRKPIPVKKWANTYDATKFGSACPQMAMDFMPGFIKPDMSEDCLFLNVYVPNQINRNKKLAVMVWIHGGALVFGFGHEYYGDRIAAQGDVIVVTINYRLGVFGFFALDHPAARGNYGLWDQKLALQWVHDNIASFGGDPDSVTLFGESAGGWSVNVQSMIPSNKGLFKRAIMQSGAFDFGRTFPLSSNQLKRYSNMLSENTKCPKDDLYQLTDCLRTKSIAELLDAAVPVPPNPDEVELTSNNAAVVDGELITDNPLVQLQDKNSDVSKFFSSIDLIGGVTSNEGSILYMMSTPAFEEHYGYNISEGMPSKFACEAVITPYVRTYLGNNVEAKRKICELCSTPGSTAEQGRKATQCFATLLIVSPVVRMLEAHRKLRGKTWQYKFSKKSPVPYGGPPPSWFEGSGHADELPYLFSGQNVINPTIKLNDEEKELSEKFIQYWTSFATFG